MGKRVPLRRGIAAALAVTFVVTTTTVFVPEVVRAASPAETAIASGIQQLVDSLKGLDGLDELGDALPFTDLLPTGTDGLGVDSVMTAIKNAIAAVGDKTAANIQTALNDLDDPVVPGLSIDTVVTGSGVAFKTLKLTKTLTKSLKFLSGDPGDPATFSLAGGSLDVALALTIADDGVTPPFVVGLDTSTVTPTIFLTSPPASKLTASLHLHPGPLAVRLGILDVDATGTVDVSLAASIGWLDPDLSGTTTLAELTTSAPGDLFDVTISSPSTAAMNLSLTSSLSGLGAVTGTVSYSDDLTNSTAPVINVSLGDLGDFTNMTPQDVLAALAQVVIGLRSMQVRLGNLDLPLVDENLAELASWADKISKLFTDNGLSLPENPIDLQISPESGTECGDGLDNDGDGTIDDGCPGQPSDLEAKGLATIEDIIAKLGLALTGVSDDLGLAYLPASDSVTFTIQLINSKFFQHTPEAALNVADELAKAGITGLGLGGTASISVDPSYSVNLVVGLDLSDLLADPATHPITERVFIVPQSGPELSLDVPIKANLDLNGHIGLLKLGLADNVTTGDGTVALLARRAGHATDPMLTVDLTGGGSDGRLSLKEIFDSLADLSVTTSANTLTLDLGSGTTVVGTLNVGIPKITLKADATIGSTPLASGEVYFEWPDLLAGSPDVTANGGFDTNFGSFNIDPSDPLAMFSTILEGIDAALGSLKSLAGAEVDTPLPIIGTSLSDLVAWFDTVNQTINSLADNPAGSLELLQLSLNAAIGQGLDLFDNGVIDFPLPTPPAASGATVDAASYQAAVNQYITDLEAWVTAHAGFVEFEYAGGELVLHLQIGVCSDKTKYTNCTFEQQLKKPFNLVLPEAYDLGGLISADTNGEVALDYNVSANIDLGVELPTVTADDGDPDSLPQISGAPRVFLLDSTGIEASVMGSATVEFGASIGPFAVQAGETDLLPETGTQCDSGNTADEDGDSHVNDGCAAVVDAEGVSPDEAECAAGDTVDDDSDGTVNDGCPAAANALVAKGGAAFDLHNDLPSTDRAYLLPEAGESGFGDWLTGITPSLTTHPDVDCAGDATPGVADFACAHLPIYFGTSAPLIFLGNLDVTIPNFDLTGITVTGADDILTNLRANAEAFVWDLIAKGIKKFGEAVDSAVSAAAYDVQVPVIGDLLDAGADVATAFKENVTDPLSDLITTLTSAADFAAIKNGISNFFWTNLNGAASDPADRFILNYDDVTAAPVQSEDIVVTVECKDGAGPVEDCETGPGGPYNLLDLYNVQVQLAIGQAAAATTPDFDWGVPGLRLSGDGTLTGTVSWQVNLGFGISLTDGFYILSKTLMSAEDDDADISVNADVDFGEVDVLDANDLPKTTADPALVGDLAFIGASLWNNKKDRINAADGGDTDGRDAHEVHLQLGVDIPDPSTTDDRIGLGEVLASFDPTNWDVTLVGKIDLAVLLATTVDISGGASEGAIPRLFADLSLTWGFTGDLTDGFSSDDLVAGFDNIRLDLGSFIAEFLAPALKEVQKYTKPLQPIIDTVQAPIPGVSQLAELVGLDPVTLMDLFELVSGNDLTMIRRLLDVITFVNSIPTSVQPGNATLIIPLGKFLLDSKALTKPEVPANVKDKLIKTGSELLTTSNVLSALGSADLGTGGAAFKSNLTKAASSDGGFTFPAFQNPSQLFQLLVGKDVSLVDFDAGTLKAETGWSQTFGPITIGPVPVSIVVSISASIEGRFVIGYDTKGIRQMIQNLSDGDSSNNGFFENLGALLAGVYLGDLAADGSDPPEIRLVLEGAVGAALDLVVVKVGIEAGLRATLDLNLHDGGFLDPVPPENLDGKLRIDEIITFLNNPLCLFDVSGKLEAFIRIFVTIDFFLFSVTFKQTIVNIVLLELKEITKDLCKPPPPKLATKSGSTLLLNMGPRIGDRDYAEDQFAEKFVVRQVTEGTSGVTVRVSAFGITQDYTGIDKVVGDGGSDDDSIVAEEGAITGVCQADGTLAPPVTGFDCTGDLSNPSNHKDDATVGETVSKPVKFQIPLHACGGLGKDKLGGGVANDKLIGNGALSGTTCDPGGAADGNDDFDRIAGQGGDDEIWGNDGDDSLSGDSGNDTIHGGDGFDEIIGGIGRDTLNGDAGGDSILGGPETDPCPSSDNDTCSNAADDTINGGSDADNIEGDHGRDTINGDGGTDTVVGGLGDDNIHGNDDADTLFGNQGNDTINGDAGDDDVVGGTGGDLINGGTGNDDLTGQEGVDTINGDEGLDVIIGDMGVINRDPGAGSFTPSAGKLLTELTNSAVPPAAGDTLNGGADADLIWGQEGDDTINGNGGDDVLRGNAGVDTMSGNAGADEMYGDAGNDIMRGDSSTPVPAGDGVDTMRGGDDNDTMSGDAKGDKLFGDAGDDTVYGDADLEGSCGTDGNDTIYGGPSADLLFGNAGDDLLSGDGGSDRVVGGSNTSGVCDGSDSAFGGEDDDVIAGDNATIGAAALADGMLVSLFLDDQGANDIVSGDNQDDRIYGQTGDDELYGQNGNDAVEGNDGTDTINGGDGDDDLVGGGSAADGVVDADRVGNGLSDVNDIIGGQGGADWIAGDNALISRNLPAAGRAPVELFDVELAGGPAPAAGTSGADALNGGDQGDEIFGQGANDTIHGDAGADYIEGNHGDDSIYGDDADDDLVGGGSADDGKIDSDRVGDGLVDGGETLISGGPGVDWIAGDNALISRAIPSGASAPIILFDVEIAGGTAVPASASGADNIDGDGDNDRIFGQGGGDDISGGDGQDYAEGNHGGDTITGDDGNDDLIGGGSAYDGKIDDDRVGNTLKDGRDIVSGSAGDDWITGDNAIVVRNIPATGREPIELFDVQTSSGPAIDADTSGGDTLAGNDDNDRIFGQGNGSQPATQTDPNDGRNNDFVGSASGSPDFDRVAGTADEDGGGWTGDVITGGLGDDQIEGNHGNDLILGNGTPGVGQDEDDVVGGGSADDGKIDGDRLNLGANLLDGADTIHGDSTDNATGDDDAITGDNAWIVRPGTKQVGAGPGGTNVDQFDRETRMTQVKTAVGTFGRDFVSGNGGHDELFGQAGDDYVEGGWGSDAIVGDLGKVTTDLLGSGLDTLCGAPRNISPNEPFVQEGVCQPTTLFRLVQLYAFDDTTTGVVSGADVLLGLDGDDWIHGGAGVDLINGDGDGGPEITDPNATYTKAITDPNTDTADFDRLFGGDSNGAGTVTTPAGMAPLGDGDAVWGGRGHDHTYGGRGDDMLDVRPDALFPATWAAWAEADVESYHNVDYIYGGYDQDAMQANVSSNGPIIGDRLFDWVGAYNVYYLCPATYGAYVSIRDQSPAIIAYLQDQAATDGAHLVTTATSSGHRELAMVFKPDVKNNSHPTYPGQPGHFFCGA